MVFNKGDKEQPISVETFLEKGQDGDVAIILYEDLYDFLMNKIGNESSN